MSVHTERAGQASTRTTRRRLAWACALAACGASYALWIHEAAPVRASEPAAPGGEGASVRDDRPSRDAVRIRVSDILTRATHEAAFDAERVGRALAELGDDAIPVLLERLEAAGAAGAAASSADAAESRAAAGLRASLQCILYALDGLDAARIEAAVRERVMEDPPEIQGALLTALGRAGCASTLRWIGLVASSGPDALDDATRPRLAAALTSFRESDPEALARLGVAARRLPDDIAWTYVGVIGQAGCPEALPVLAEVLDDRPELIDSVLPHLISLSERYPHLVSADVQESVRWHLLDGGSASELRELARAVAAVRDSESLATLIVLLEHDDAAVNDAARQALERVSGRTLGSRPGPWTGWLAREEEWFDQRMGPLVRALDRGSLGDLTSALAEIGQHRYRGDDLALVVVDLLKRDAPLVRVRTCQTLQALRSERAIPDLVAALEDGEEQVRSAAHAALRAIAGADLGDDARLWREHFRIEE